MKLLFISHDVRFSPCSRIMGIPAVGIDGDFFQFFQIAGILESCYFPVFEVRSTQFLLFTVFRVGVDIHIHTYTFLAEMEGDRIFVRSDPPDGFCTVRICFCERSDCRVTTATFYEVHYSFFVNLHFGHFSHTLII